MDGSVDRDRHGELDRDGEVRLDEGVGEGGGRLLLEDVSEELRRRLLTQGGYRIKGVLPGELAADDGLDRNGVLVRTGDRRVVGEVTSARVEEGGIEVELRFDDSPDGRAGYEVLSRGMQDYSVQFRRTLDARGEYRVHLEAVARGALDDRISTERRDPNALDEGTRSK